MGFLKAKCPPSPGDREIGYFFRHRDCIFRFANTELSLSKSTNISFCTFLDNPNHPKMKNMKRFIIALIIVVISSTLLYSCSRSVTPEQAASHHYSRCRDMR